MAQTGYTPISIYYSATTTNVPTAGNLVAGELAINTADGKLFYKDSAGVVQVIAGKGGAGVAGGSTTQVQYNSSGSLAGSANMTFSGTALTLANDASISGLTVGKGGGSDSTALGYQAGNAGTSNYYTMLGYQAGFSNTDSSAGGVFIGWKAGYANTSGQANIAIGVNALLSNTTASNNTAIGTASLFANTTGSPNVAIGTASLRFNTTGSSNVAIGYQSLYSNTTATANTAVGFQALYSNTTGNYNHAFGYQALYTTANTGNPDNHAFGFQAGYSTTTGFVHAFGHQALYANTTGNSNNAFGYFALKSNTTGSSNVAYGDYSLQASTTASNNTAVGYQAGYTYSGSYGTNTYIGNKAGYSMTTGGGNTVVGQQSGYSLTTGNGNTFIGPGYNSNGAGYNVTTGSLNTIIGGYNGNQGGLDIRTASNYIVLSDGDGNPRGYWDNGGAFYQEYQVNIGKPNTSNLGLTGGITLRPSGGDSYLQVAKNYSTAGSVMYFYNTNGLIGNIGVNGSTTSYNTSSDYRLKENVALMANALDKVALLKPVTYTWKADGSHGEGFIAHELQAVVPEAVTGEKDAVNEDGSIKPQSIDTSFLVATLTAAIQELKAEVDSLKQQLGK